MKDMVKKMPKAQNVIKLIILTFFSNTILSQNNSNESILENEYDVINSIFIDQNNDDSKLYIYYRTYSDKGWSCYFSDENLKFITDNVNIPTEISDEELKTYLNNIVIKKVYNNIYYLSRPLTIDPDKILNKNIKLVKSFDKPSDLKKGVVRISKPIIIGDIAIFRKIGFNESPIYILKNEGGKWKIVYTFYDWLIIE